jgi:hypothetical protein
MSADPRQRDDGRRKARPLRQANFEAESRLDEKFGFEGARRQPQLRAR